MNNSLSLCFFLSIFDVKVKFVKIQIIAYVTGYFSVWHYPAKKSTVEKNSFSSNSSSSTNEQQKIASILSGVDAYIQKNQEYKEKLEILKKGLMQKLLTGQIRV